MVLFFQKVASRIVDMLVCAEQLNRMEDLSPPTSGHPRLSDHTSTVWKFANCRKFKNNYMLKCKFEKSSKKKKTGAASGETSTPQGETLCCQSSYERKKREGAFRRKRKNRWSVNCKMSETHTGWVKTAFLFVCGCLIYSVYFRLSSLTWTPLNC